MATGARLRVGVLGAGSWAAVNHIPILRAREDVDLVVACRRGQRELAWLQHTFGFEYVTEDPQRVYELGLDAVVVASPPNVHHEHVAGALRSGAHVLCEKPFTIDPLQAWELVELARALDRHLLVAFGWNYHPMAIAAGRLIADGSLGEVEHVMVAMASGVRSLLTAPLDDEVDSTREASGLPVRTDRRTWADPRVSGGGYAQAQLSHAMGLALGLTGERVVEVMAMMRSSTSPEIDLHDALAVRLASGATMSVSGATAYEGARLRAEDELPRHQLEVRVFGDRGQLVVDFERAMVWRSAIGHEDVRLALDDDAGRYVCDGPPAALVDLASGRAGAVNRASGELGAATVDLLDGAYRSARAGRVATIAKFRARSRHSTGRMNTR